MSSPIKSMLGRATLPVLTVFASALLAAWMVDLAPGDAVSVHELDARLSDRTLETIRTERASSSSEWFARLARGELGESATYGRPIAELLRERAPATASLVGKGLALAWGAALIALTIGLAVERRWLDAALSAMSGTFLSLPSALLALLCLYLDWPPVSAIAVLAFPRLYRYLRELADRQRREAYVLAGFARGTPKSLVITRHVLVPIAPVALTMLGVSVSMALGAAVPVEALCDLPGIGQLAWEAALTRDLPLLVALTVVVTLVTVAANILSDLAVAFMEPQNA